MEDEKHCAAETLVSLMKAASTGFHFCEVVRENLIGGASQCEYCSIRKTPVTTHEASNDK